MDDVKAKFHTFVTLETNGRQSVSLLTALVTVLNSAPCHKGESVWLIGQLAIMTQQK